MLGDLGINEFTPMTLEPGKGASLIESHETAISGHIGGENGREPAFDPLSAQTLPPRKAIRPEFEPPQTD